MSIRMRYATGLVLVLALASPGWSAYTLSGSAADRAAFVGLLNSHTLGGSWSQNGLQQLVFTPSGFPLNNFALKLDFYNSNAAMTLEVGRGQPGILVGGFLGGGVQRLDLNDIQVFPPNALVNPIVDLRPAVVMHELTEVFVSTAFGFPFVSSHFPFAIGEENIELASQLSRGRRLGPGDGFLFLGGPYRAILIPWFDVVTGRVGILVLVFQNTNVVGGRYIRGGLVELAEAFDPSTSEDIPAESMSFQATPPHFQCYELRRQTFVGPVVSLHDQFGSVGGVFVQKPERLCAPADKNDEDPPAPADPEHLTGYRLRYPFTKVPNQRITNQFGEVFVDVVKPDSLLVPSAKSLSGPPAPIDPTYDHFQCYKVRRTRGSARFLPIPNVKVEDQFGTVFLTLRKPIRLCAPVDKNGEAPGTWHHPDHLLCYQTARTAFGEVTAFLDDQFGASSRPVIRRQEFCVPSRKNQPPTTTTTTTTTTGTTTTTLSPCGNLVIDPGEHCDPPGSITCPPGSPAGAFVPCAFNCRCPAVTTTTTTAGSTTTVTGTTVTTTTTPTTTTTSPPTPIKRLANVPLMSESSRGHFDCTPKVGGGPDPYNCLAFSLGLTHLWTQPIAGGGPKTAATMKNIMEDDHGCTIQPCPSPLAGATNPCPSPKHLALLSYHQKPGDTAPVAPACPANDDNWVHAMRLDGTDGWRSKNGEAEDYANIHDPVAFMDGVPDYKPTGTETRSLCCYCCPPTTTSTTTITTTTSTTTTT